MKVFAIIVALIPLAMSIPTNIYVPAPSYGGYNPAPSYGGLAPNYGHHAAPAYGYGRPAHGRPAHGYGYERPKHNCTVRDVTESAEVCTPAFKTTCENIDLPIKRIVDKEFCYTVTRTVCTERIDEIDNEVCSYSYSQKKEETTGRTVEVSFKRETKVQMVTVCQPGYGGYGPAPAYGHNYCNEVAQETAYNVPVVTQIDVPVTVAYPEPIRSCVNKPILLPRVSCEDLSEEKCITVPEIEEAVESVEKCITQLDEPSCQDIELTLPKQVCVELVYGYAHEVGPSYPSHHEKSSEAPTTTTTAAKEE